MIERIKDSWTDGLLPFWVLFAVVVPGFTVAGLAVGTTGFGIACGVIAAVVFLSLLIAKLTLD